MTQITPQWTLSNKTADFLCLFGYGFLGLFFFLISRQTGDGLCGGSAGSTHATNGLHLYFYFSVHDNDGTITRLKHTKKSGRPVSRPVDYWLGEMWLKKKLGGDSELGLILTKKSIGCVM